MDIRSIVRAFRYGQMQDKAARDPDAKVPPTIKFLALIVLIGIVGAVLGLVWLQNVENGGLSDTAGPLEVTEPTNETSPHPTPTASAEPGQRSAKPATFLTRED